MWPSRAPAKPRGSIITRHSLATYYALSVSGNWTLNSWVEVLSVRNTLTGSGAGTLWVAATGFDITTEPTLG